MSGFRRMMMAKIKPYHPNETVYDVTVSSAATDYIVKLENPYRQTVFEWGDGSVNVEDIASSVREVTHTYLQPGNYTIRVYSADKNNGQYSSYCIQHAMTASSAELVTRVRQVGNYLFRGQYVFRGINLSKVDTGCKITALVDARVDQFFQQCGTQIDGGTVINDDFTIPENIWSAYGFFYFARVHHLPKQFRIPAACRSIQSFADNANFVYGADISNIFPEEWSELTATINIASAFCNAKGVTGTAPAHLLWNAPNITWSNTNRAFLNCTGLTNYNEIPSSWGGGGA